MCPTLSKADRQTARSWATAIPLLTVATEREARESSLTAAGFEGHFKNTPSKAQRAPLSVHTREPESSLSLFFSLTLSLLPHPLSLPSPSPTTAKSIEMTTQLEGHSRAQRGSVVECLPIGGTGERVEKQIQSTPALLPACPADDPAGGAAGAATIPLSLPIYQHAKWSWVLSCCALTRGCTVSISFPSKIWCLFTHTCTHTH